ncbi:MAG: hypothetical protein WBB44_01225 [Candidatus Nanopelagicales bacterium]|nr:hypothetical protein [Candidatus Nanopelagicales bacterium]
MGLFNRKQSEQAPGPPPLRTDLIADLPAMGAPLPESLRAHSGFIKRAECQRCGAPKKLPTKTAYIYCDYCAALVDYDFRIANADTNAGITNTVFHRLMAYFGPQLDHYKAYGDRENYRRLQRDLFYQWVNLCPQAVSPRAKTDVEFRDRLIAYFAETAATKDLDPAQAPLDAQMRVLEAGLQRIPTPNGAWMIGGTFWQFAEVWKQQMDLAYSLINSTGVNEMDPDDSPPGVPLAMEYSTFCQSWLAHLPPEDGEKLLAMYGLNAEYVRLEPQNTNDYNCGGCGSKLLAMADAHTIICEDCGGTVDVTAAPIPCGNCGAPLSFPKSASHLSCPYCQSEIQQL